MRELQIIESNFISGGAAVEENPAAPPPCTDGVEPISTRIPAPLPWELWWIQNQPQLRPANQPPRAPEEDGFPTPPALGDVMP